MLSISICLSIVVLAPFSALAVSRYEVLQIGDEDAWVEELQEKLHETDYLKCNPTGYFGTDTQNAVIQFQTDNGLVVDGKMCIRDRFLRCSRPPRPASSFYLFLY